MTWISLISLLAVVQFEDKHHSSLLKVVADQLKCSPSDIVDFELNVCDTQDGVIGGEACEINGFVDTLVDMHGVCTAQWLDLQMLFVHVVLFSRECFMHLSTWTHYLHSTCMTIAPLR